MENLKSLYIAYQAYRSGTMIALEIRRAENIQTYKTHACMITEM